MKTQHKQDLTPWLLAPCIALTLSAVTLLGPHQAAVAAPPKPAQAAAPMPVYDDGDGDELLEHWGDPKYSQEARRQMTGMACGFLVLGAAALRRKSRRHPRVSCEIVQLPTEADFLKLDTQARTNTRKAA